MVLIPPICAPEAFLCNEYSQVEFIVVLYLHIQSMLRGICVKRIRRIWGRIERPLLLVLVFVFLFAWWAIMYKFTKVVLAFFR